MAQEGGERYLGLERNEYLFGIIVNKQALKGGGMSKTLVLNATYAPLSVISIKRAIVLVMEERAEMVAEADGSYHSAKASFPIPSIIRLKKFIKIPYKTTARLTNRALLQRDDWTCAYCGEHATTVDHVKPRSQGGKHRWNNVVAACKPCNSRKANKTPAEAGMKLLTKPYTPETTLMLVVGIREPDPRWEPYLTGAAALA